MMSEEEKKTVLAEFVERYVQIENEQKLLATDKRDLVSDYKDKLDMKTVQAAMRWVRMRAKLDVPDSELDTLVVSLENYMSR